MLGSGVGTKGAGGPGILQIFGSVAVAIPLLPLVTGVLGGLTPTLITGLPGVDGSARGQPQPADLPPSYSRSSSVSPSPSRVVPRARQASQTMDRTPHPYHPNRRPARHTRLDQQGSRASATE